MLCQAGPTDALAAELAAALTKCFAAAVPLFASFNQAQPRGRVGFEPELRNSRVWGSNSLFSGGVDPFGTRNPTGIARNRTSGAPQEFGRSLNAPS